MNTTLGFFSGVAAAVAGLVAQLVRMVMVSAAKAALTDMRRDLFIEFLDLVVWLLWFSRLRLRFGLLLVQFHVSVLQFSRPTGLHQPPERGRPLRRASSERRRARARSPPAARSRCHAP